MSEPVPGGMLLSARGRIGSGTVEAFAGALAAALARGPRLVIDLEGVDYISGSGIAALRRATDEGQAIICGLQEPVRITLELAGLLQSVPVEPSRAAAIERLAG